MNSRNPHVKLVSLGAAGILTFALAACGSSTSGSGSPAGNPAGAAAGSSSSSDSSSSGGGSGEAASSADALASNIVDATSKGTTVHLVLQSEGGGSASAASNGEGDVKTGDDGKTEAFTVTVGGSGDSSVTIVYVDGTGYVKLPTASQTDPSKPWAKVSSTSSNPVVKALSTSFDQIDSQTSLTQYGDIVKSASNFTATGETEVDGTKAQGYSFDVDPKDLPNASQFGSAISSIGTIPTTLAVDDQGRPVQLVQKITISGTTLTTTVTLSDYGKDVTIEAPSADQISSE